MRMLVPLFVVFLAGASTALDIPPGPPTQFALHANDPNPFCPATGPTAIRFEIPTACEAQLLVRDSGSNLVRTLVDAALQAGLHEVIWDGRDDGGTIVPDGTYPFALVARVGGLVVFEGTQTATVSCLVGVEEATWSRVKALFGDGRNAQPTRIPE